MGYTNVGRRVSKSFSSVVLKSVLSFAVAAQGSVTFAEQTPEQRQKVANDVAAQLKRIAGTKASFCYAVNGQAITGYNENEPVRTASVTKTLTTFWAVEKLGPNFQYTTRFYYQPSTGELHIEGQRDPFFDRDRIFTVLADLNKIGVTRVNRMTYDSNFWMWLEATEIRYMRGGSLKSPGAYSLGSTPFKHFVESESHTDATVAGNSSRIATNIKYFDTTNWDSGLRTRYQKSRVLNSSLALPSDVKLSIGSIDTVLASNNPLKGKPGVLVFESKSAPIRNYLKMMNIWSINPYAEEIFFSLGGKPEFQRFMETRYGFGSRVANVNTGSGVNMHGNARNDSTVSCSTVVSMIRQMDSDLETRWKMDLSDVLSVPGNDGGTWVDPTKTLIVKTGTLNNPTPDKNLAGAQETTDGEVYFGIFIDRRGGVRSNVQRALSAMQRNFRGVKVVESAYNFSPVGSYTHLAPPIGAVNNNASVTITQK